LLGIALILLSAVWPSSFDPREQPSSAAPQRRQAGPRKVVKPPSWRRAIGRAAIFGPLLVMGMIFLNHDLPLAQEIAPAIILLVFFVPFSYFADFVAYRMYGNSTTPPDDQAKLTQ
jgi:hypothetical protein